MRRDRDDKPFPCTLIGGIEQNDIFTGFGSKRPGAPAIFGDAFAFPETPPGIDLENVAVAAGVGAVEHGRGVGRLRHEVAEM